MLTTLGERAAASVEREFPLQLRTIRSKKTFKNSYKTFLFKKSFQQWLNFIYPTRIVL